MTVREALRAGALRLAGSPSSALDAQVLLVAVLGISRGQLLADDSRVLAGSEEKHFLEYCERRAAHEPVAYIVGWRDFWKDTFRVTPAVLIPRPETEHLIEAAVKFFPDTVRLLDIGTGTGCLVISLVRELLALEEAVACDISPEALAVAAENSHAIFQNENRLSFVLSDVYESIVGRFDLIVSNPPYVTELEYAGLEPNVRNYEPRLALEAGAEGLDVYRRILKGACDHLLPGGGLILEVSDATAEHCVAMASEARLSVVALLPDLAGHKRVLVARG